MVPVRSITPSREKVGGRGECVGGFVGGLGREKW